MRQATEVKVLEHCRCFWLGGVFREAGHGWKHLADSSLLIGNSVASPSMWRCDQVGTQKE